MKKKAILFMLVLIFISTNALSQNWIQGQLFFTAPWDVSVEIYRVSCGSDVLVDTNTTNTWEGYYGFGCLANGLYRVVPDNSWVFDPEFSTVQIPRAELWSYNFIPYTYLTPYGISGTVSGDVQEGVTITLSALTSHTSATTTTASDGTYNFTELFTGAYTITPCMSSYAFDPKSELVSPFGDSDVTGVDFTATSTP
jgi:hypothetical protein